MIESGEHISCQEVVEIVTDLPRRRATRDRDRAVRAAHQLLRRLLLVPIDQMTATVAAVGRLREEDLPAETRERLLVAFRDWKRR